MHMMDTPPTPSSYDEERASDLYPSAESCAGSVTGPCSRLLGGLVMLAGLVGLFLIIETGSQSVRALHSVPLNYSHGGGFI